MKILVTIFVALLSSIQVFSQLDAVANIAKDVAGNLKPVILSTAPLYTTLEKVLTLQPGMTKMEVTNLLGVSPYNILINQQGSGSVYLWHYKKLERKLPLFIDVLMQQKYLEKPENLTSGEPAYNGDFVLYCFFDGAGKLVTILSDEGIKDATLLLENVKDFHKSYNSGAH